MEAYICQWQQNLSSRTSDCNTARTGCLKWYWWLNCSQLITAFSAEARNPSGQKTSLPLSFFSHYINYINLFLVASPLSKPALLCFCKAMPSPNTPAPFQHCCTLTFHHFTSSNCNVMFCDSCLSGFLQISKSSVKGCHSWHIFHGEWMLRIPRFLAA